MNSLVYIRRCDSFNRSVLDFAVNNLSSSKITTVSEYFNGDLRIDMNSKTWDYCNETQRFVDTHLDVSSIIFRDRVLRNIPFNECLVLIRRALGNILSCFSESKYDTLVIYPVDNFIMDILVSVAKLKGVQCYGVCNFFLSEYKRLTLFGEHAPYREPSEDEVHRVVNKLQANFKSHMAPSKRTALKGAIIRYLRYKIRYPIFYVFFHKVLGRNEYDLPCTIRNTTVRSFLNFFAERYFVTLDKVDFSKKSILVPLHYFPEATIEYWSGDCTKVEFEDMLLCKIDELSHRYEQIILKEHPATLYDNPGSFYRRLLSNKKVILVDPFVSTNRLLEDVDVLGCWTGTAGIEALVNGKSVELFVKEQYYIQAMNLHPEIVSIDNGLCKINSPHTLIREILKGCIPNAK